MNGELKMTQRRREKASTESGECAFSPNEAESTKKRRKEEDKESRRTRRKRWTRQGTCNCHVARQLPQTADKGVSQYKTYA